MNELKPKQDISIEIVSGVEGLCLLVNDYRVAGPKPWGGGTVTQSLKTKLADIERAIYGNRRAQPENEPLTLDELRQMDGEPVYIVEHPKWGHWELSDNAEDYLMDRHEEFYNMTHKDPAGKYGLHAMGWIAYRRKPERSEG